ncbi:hypothetical protein LJC46_04765 [Desulfovibrio sp. OttesenSCG-928-G15]|nr:hypothetical protein [Desulfovibrio sp. OttesenSCG-928-G15]
MTQSVLFEAPAVPTPQQLACPGGEIVIYCGDTPDEDALGAAFALHLYLAPQCKRCRLLHSANTPLRPKLAEMVTRLGIPLEQCNGVLSARGLLILVASRQSMRSTPEFEAPRALCLTNKEPGSQKDAEYVAFPHLTAVSTLVWQFFRTCGHTPCKTAATALLFGLYAASNAFTQLRFPTDRDMADFLQPDENIYNRLIRSNFTEQDLDVASSALHAVESHKEPPFVLLNVMPCDTGVLRFIADFTLQVAGVDIAVIFYENSRGITFSIRSGAREFSASELAEKLSGPDTGYGGGSRQKGGGFIAAEKYLLRHEADSFFDHSLACIRKYLTMYDILDCALATVAHPESMRAYQKLPVIQGYVRCSTLFPRKSRLHIRMLEGDITVLAHADTYLMIGLSGEVYPISKAVFEKNYIPLNTPFIAHYAYAPSVVDKDSAQRILLPEHASACRSKEGRVLARQLDKGLKIFTLWDDACPVKGEPGDWLVIRKENAHDAYIIKEDEFARLYSPVRG